MKIICIAGLLIFLLYLYYNPNNIERFETLKSINSDNIFKENHDLNYIKNRTKLDINKVDNVRTQPIAPLTTPNYGKDPYPKTVNAQDLLLSSRIPDRLSSIDKYTIPMPKFDDLQKPVKLIKKIKKLKKPHKKEIENKNRLKNISNSCKFISSNNKNFKCPKDYPIFTGASFGIQGKNVSCNGEKIIQKRAKAVASINKGQITEIIITEKGSHYDSPPKVKIIKGGGKYATAYALVKKGSVDKVIITNSGSGYSSTPIIKISEPNAIINCNLCCQNEF